MMPYDRFEHEQRLMQCWQITDALQLLAEGIVDRSCTAHDTAIILRGLQSLYELKFNALWDSFESSVS